MRTNWASALLVGMLACGDAALEPRDNDGVPPLPADGGGGSSSSSGGALVDAALDAPPAPLRTTIRVHYAGIAGSLGLRGSSTPLDWDASAQLTDLGDDTFEWSSEGIVGELEFKPMLDDAWSLGPNYRVAAGATIDVAPHFVATRGEVSRRWPTFVSTELPSTRGVWVYLPPTYVENTAARFDVLYMHDGQNLFSAETAFGGNEWQVDETLDRGAADGSIREVVVVGIENTEARIEELTPSHDPEYGGGDATRYLSMIEREIIPMVNSALRTVPGREHCSMMGSSLGGLVSLFAGVHDAASFDRIGAMSPSTWWDERMILTEIDSLPTRSPVPLRFYVDSGNAGTQQDDVLNTAELARRLRAAGYQDEVSLRYVVQDGATHQEQAWAARLPAALQFLLGPR